MGDELIPMSELAKQAGVPLSTANKYARRHPDAFHPTASPRGNRFPVTDLQILKDMYESSPRHNQKPPQRPKSRNVDKSHKAEKLRQAATPVRQRQAEGGTLPIEPLAVKVTERVPGAEADAQAVHVPAAEPNTQQASLQEAQPNTQEAPMQDAQLATQEAPVPVGPDTNADSKAHQHAAEGLAQPSVESIVEAVTASFAVDVERLLQMERQIITVLGNIDQRYRFMFDQFDQLNRIIARSWETQQMFAETINQTLDRFKQHDKIIDMLMEHSKKLEKENSRLMVLFSAAEEAAATLQPADRYSPTPEERNTPSNIRPAAKPAPVVEESRGFLRRRRRRR